MRYIIPEWDEEEPYKVYKNVAIEIKFTERGYKKLKEMII